MAEPGTAATTYALLADMLAVVHAAYVLFVVVGQGLILSGWAAGWRWTRNRAFRWLHLGAIGLVVAEVVLGVYCPLTTLEARWRSQAGQGDYAETFIGYWADRLLYYEVPLEQMHLVYVLFAIVVLWTFVKYPPEGPRPKGPRPKGPRPKGPRPKGPRPKGRRP
jgi:hypothetical protein